jgi:hypothetical protein
LRHQVVESLLSIGGKLNKKDSIDLLQAGLLIKCKETGHKYTVTRVDFENGKPVVVCYRHYGPKKTDIVYVKLQETDFSDYEAA